MKVIRVIFFIVGLLCVWQTKAEVKATFSDTTIIRLMNTFQFRDAANTLNGKLRKTNKNDFDMLLYYNNQLSMAYIRLMLVDSAMTYARKSMHLSVFSSDSTLISDGWKVTSYSYNRCGNLDSAIFYTKKMYAYAERHQDKRLMRNSMSSLGTIMNQNEKFEEGLKYHKSAFELTKEIKDSLSYSIMFFNLGLTYFSLNKPDSSLFYLQECLTRALNEKHFESALDAYVMISNIYLELNDLKKWKESTLNLYNLAEKVQNQKFIAHAYNNFLYGLIKSNDFREAVSYGEKAVKLLDLYPFQSLQIEVDSGLYVANKALGDYYNAMKYFESFYKRKYSLLNENQKRELSEVQVKFAVKEKDLMIAQQKLELSHKQKNIQSLVFILTLFIFIILASAAYVIRNHRFRKELYKKEKYLDKQLSDTKQWMEGVFLKDNFIPTVFKQLPFEGESSLVNQDILSPQSILYSELREIIEKQKLYLNPELNLQMVIKLLGTNKKYLYEAISSNTDNNFRNFINRYRIDHAKRLIEESIRDKTNSNLSELFNICGFNNTTSFFRTFKSITGLTPKEYSAEVENDVREENQKFESV